MRGSAVYRGTSFLRSRLMDGEPQRHRGRNREGKEILPASGTCFISFMCLTRINWCLTHLSQLPPLCLSGQKTYFNANCTILGPPDVLGVALAAVQPVVLAPAAEQRIRPNV